MGTAGRDMLAVDENEEVGGDDDDGGIPRR